MTDTRETILRWIDEDRNKLIDFLAQFVRIATPNPPGDTRQAALFLRDQLAAQGVAAELRSARPEWPNLVASFTGSSPGPHLLLNGHIDVFPAGPRATWSRDPWSGAIADGKVHGRGSVDMKCGTAASVWTYIYLHRLRARLGGRLTLTCVSDEETGGTWGVKWLIDTFADEFLADCVLNAEPSTPGLVRFGEKGTLRVVFEVTTPGAHGAYTHASKNAIKLASDVIQDLYRLEHLPIAQSPEMRQLLAASQTAIDRVLGAGGGAILNRYTVSVGVIHGGIKINMLPGQCRFEVDFRLPIATAHSGLMQEIGAICAGYPEVRMQTLWAHSAEPTASDPRHRMMQILTATVNSLTGVEPVASVGLGATDMKHWRARGVPAYVYGCTPTNMAKPDECVASEEYIHILRTHALAAASYLTPEP
jgi:succinyl-diaminopimelate desuccinylase